MLTLPRRRKTPAEKGCTGQKQLSSSRFTQQELPANQPLLTAFWVERRPELSPLYARGLSLPSYICVPLLQFSIVSLSIGCIFTPVGAGCLKSAQEVVEVVSRYDDRCIDGESDREKEATLLQTNGAGAGCNITLTVPKTLLQPVLVYYGINGFQQNHRRYVRSRSDSQIRGNPASQTISYCEPQEFLAGNRSQLIRPCGLAAWSLFNDTFQVSAGSASLAIDQSDIAWGQDRRHKYAALPALFFNTDPGLRGGAAVAGDLSDAEHLIVWMRPATLPNFRKLWGRIRQDVPAGTQLTVSIANRYNTYRFSGRKYVVLTTANGLGGRNMFLGAAYLGVGGGSLALGAAMALASLLCRQQRQKRQLSWERPAPVERLPEETMYELPTY